MNPEEFCQLAERLMRFPAAPGHEMAVRTQVEQICAEHGLDHKRDQFGNLLIRVKKHSTLRPLVLAAHLDHPGFEIVRRLSSDRWLARFLGGVPDSYFRRGLPLRVVPGLTAATLEKKFRGNKQFEIRTGSLNDPRPQFAVWELPDFAVAGGRIHGRSCDDLIGVASTLAALIELKRTRSRVNVIGVISRAEEIGFQGALTVAASRQLPKDSLVISLETSRELPPVKMGQGMIIRVGDRTSIFDSEATRFLCEVASSLSAKDSSFPWQRALMSGGTCEATAFQEFGFQTAAVCIALGNYHNCGDDGKIAAEFVSIADACGMARLLVETARQMRSYSKRVAKLPARLKVMLKTARKALK